jgi:hypothetical protein
MTLRPIVIKDHLGRRTSQRTSDFDVRFSLKGNLILLRHRVGDRFTHLGLKEARRLKSWLDRYIQLRENMKQTNGEVEEITASMQP